MVGLVAGTAATTMLILLSLAGLPGKAAAVDADPNCWDPNASARPGLEFSVEVVCFDTHSADLSSVPDDVAISNISMEGHRLYFDVEPDPDASGTAVAEFDLEGHGGSKLQEIAIEIKPVSENSPPRCTGDRESQRTDGTRRVEFYLHPHCWDPDDDPFVMRGGPVGTHPDSPHSVRGGTSEANWPYLTDITDGTEVSTVWATDALGARSGDAELEVTVGPGVDRLPTCHPNPAIYADSFPIYSRPGVPRDFVLLCEDLDGDGFDVDVVDSPSLGFFSRFDVNRQDGAERGFRAVGVTYQPLGSSLGRDPFSVRGIGGMGAGPVVPMEMVPIPYTDNGGGGCGYSPTSITVDTPGTIKFSCTDSEGDLLSAEVLKQPDHGTVGAAVVEPNQYAEQRISIPYTPDPGYTGYDWIQVSVTDGYGLEFELKLDIHVHQPFFPFPVGPIPPSQETDANPKRLAKQLFGKAKRVRGLSGAKVWRAKKLSARKLVRRGELPAVVVGCKRECQVRSKQVLLPGGSKRRRAGRTVDLLRSGSSNVISLKLNRSERRAVRNGKRSKAKISLVVDGRGKPRRVSSSIRLSR